MNITRETRHAKLLPVDEIKGAIQNYIQPGAKQLPDLRLKRGLEDMVLGILGNETPVITEMVGQNRKDDEEKLGHRQTDVPLARQSAGADLPFV